MTLDVVDSSMTMDETASGTETRQNTYTNPLAELEGMKQVKIECMAGIQFTDTDEHCDGWCAEIELDEPASYDTETERIHLPGFSWECPECGQPHNFEVEGISVSNLV